MSMQDVVSRGWQQKEYCIKDGLSVNEGYHFSGLLQTSFIYTRAWMGAGLEPSCGLRAICQAQEEIIALGLPPTASLLSEILR